MPSGPAGPVSRRPNSCFFKPRRPPPLAQQFEQSRREQDVAILLVVLGRRSAPASAPGSADDDFPDRKAGVHHEVPETASWAVVGCRTGSQRLGFSPTGVPGRS